MAEENVVEMSVADKGSESSVVPAQIKKITYEGKFFDDHIIYFQNFNRKNVA